jgi:hypothetical protein
VGKQKLLDAGLDPRMDTALAVTLLVDKDMPSPPLVNRSRFALGRDGKRKLVAILLGSSTGFGIKLPDIPRVLVADAASEAVLANCNNLTGPKAEWWGALRLMAHKHGSLIREPKSDLEARQKACNELWEHLEKVNPARASASTDQLWTAAELTRSWMDVVAAPSDVINDHERDGHQYTLKLHGISPEVTYILACLLTSFALLCRHDESVTAAFDKVLHGSSSASARAARTDSESGSDGEDGWTRASARRRMRPGALQKRLVEFTSKHLCSARYTADSDRPALQMATTVHIRPWEHRYISCDVSNLESIGCAPDDAHLASNANFIRVATAIPELASPMAQWVVHQRCGFYTVNLFVREDCKDVVAKLNDRLRSIMGIPSIALEISCWVVRRSRGRVVHDSQVRVSLTPEVPRKPSLQQQRRAAAASAYAAALPPPTDSWAGRVLEGVRRAAPVNNLDHRPRKHQKKSMPAAQPPKTTSASNAPTRAAEQHTTASASPAGQSSVDSVSKPRSAHEAPLPPALASLRKMVEDSNRRIDTLLDIPRQVHALSDRLVQMEAASTAFTQILTGMQMQMEGLARSMAALHKDVVGRLSAANSARPNIAAAAPDPLPSTDATMTLDEAQLSDTQAQLTQAAAAAAPCTAMDDDSSTSPRSNAVSLTVMSPVGARHSSSSGPVHGSPTAATSASASPARKNGLAVRYG